MKLQTAYSGEWDYSLVQHGMPRGVQYDGGGGSPPQTQSVGEQTKENLQAQIDAAPGVYGAEKTYTPKYTALVTQGLQNYLTGQNTEDGTKAPGYLDVLENIQPRVNNLSASTQTAQRAADINDVATLGPQATQAFQNANPQQMRLLDEINRQTLDQLGQGSSLDQDLLTNLRQQVRGSQAARGLGTGSGDAGLEAYSTAMAGNALRQQRLQNANQVAGLNQATTADPFQLILGRPATAFAAGQNIANNGNAANNASGPRLFNPQNQFSQNVYDTNLSAQTAAYNAQQNNSAGIFGSVIGGIATLGGGALSGGLFK